VGMRLSIVWPVVSGMRVRSLMIFPSGSLFSQSEINRFALDLPVNIPLLTLQVKGLPELLARPRAEACIRDEARRRFVT